MSSLTAATLTGHRLDERNILELHAKRVSASILVMAQAMGYDDAALIGVSRQVIKAWREIGVRSWASFTLDSLARWLLLTNPELDAEEKDSAFFLVTCAACLFCLDRAVVHGRRGHIDLAERWMSGAQELRFARLATGFSAIKSKAIAGAEAKDAKHHSAKRKKIRDIWASKKYSSRDICAEQECAALGMSFSTARKALRGTPDPS